MRQVATFIPGEGRTSSSHRLCKKAGKLGAGAAAAKTIDYRTPYAARSYARASRKRTLACNYRAYAAAVINEGIGAHGVLSMPLSPQHAADPNGRFRKSSPGKLAVGIRIAVSPPPPHISVTNTLKTARNSRAASCAERLTKQWELRRPRGRR